MASTNDKQPDGPATSHPAPSNRERVELYQRLRRVARKYDDATSATKHDVVATAADEMLDAEAAGRVLEGVPEVDGLGELDAFAVAYLSGLLDGTVGDWIDADQDTRFDGCSPQIVRIRRLMPRLSRSWRSVLLIGERGSGKGQVMRAIASAQETKPLTINMAAVSGSLADSELFGHERGSFTGADQSRKGIVKTASDTGAPLYLDDVAESSERIQARLLTCLDDGIIRAVGSDRIIPLGRGRHRKFRVFSSTQPGALYKLRPDLRDRLAGLLVVLPPLREMGLDVLLLADVALRSQSDRRSKAKRRARFSRGARRAMLNYSWSGNVRQLFNVVGRAVAKADGAPRIGSQVVQECLRDEQWLEKLGADPDSDSGPSEYGGEPVRRGRAPFPTWADAEERLLRDALEWTGGNLTRAAELLDVSRTTLHRRRKRIRQEGSQPQV